MLATASFIGAIAIGVAGAITISPLLVPLVLVGGLLVPAYNLELAGGRFHNDTWFALAWGGFPAFTGYFVNALTIRPAGVLVAAACCLLSAAQRQLSTPVRQLAQKHDRGDRPPDTSETAESSSSPEQACPPRTRTR